jgi:hypothetical protein
MWDFSELENQTGFIKWYWEGERIISWVGLGGWRKKGVFFLSPFFPFR